MPKSPQQIEDEINKADAEIMDWFYQCCEINFDVKEMVQDSTELREILEENFKSIRASAVLEFIEGMIDNVYKKNMRYISTEKDNVLGALVGVYLYQDDILSLLNKAKDSLTNPTIQ